VSAARAVEIHGIERALLASWREIAESSGEGITRTLTANLIAVCADPHRHPDMEQAVQRAVQRHPCRAFAVVGGADTLSASLSTSTMRSGLGTAIVLERVDLECPDDDFDKLPGLLRPLMEGDVPSHLYWHGPIDTPGRIVPIGDLVDRVIVDSSTFSDPVADLGRMQSLTSEHGFTVCDLTWFRLRPWRRALAEAFQHVAWTPEIPTRAVIHHPTDGRGLAAALQLAEWLRDRLRASITLMHGVGEGPPDHHEPVEVALAVGDAFVRVHRMAGSPRLELTVTLADHCRLPTQLPVSRGACGDLLAAAMDGH